MSYRKTLTERVIQIPLKLVHRPQSRQELAHEFGVSGKTIKRDIDVLSCEFPIVEEKRGREVYYSYSEDYKFSPPVFSTQEIATLLLAQRSISAIGITAKHSIYGRQSDTILKKIRKPLPETVRRKLDVLSEVYGSAQLPEKDFSGSAEIVDRLASCAAREKRVEIRYHSLGRNENKTRALEPYSVYFDPDGATLKLIAFDKKYNALRVFSIDRISNVKELDEKFRKQKGFNLKDYLEANCFNGIHGERITVRLKARGVTARIFSERKFHPSQKVVKRKQKRGSKEEEVMIEMRVAGGRGLQRFILSYLPEIEVVAPKNLREEINKILWTSLPKE